MVRLPTPPRRTGGAIRLGLSGLPPDRVRALVESSRASQGLPPKVTDAVAVARVVTLLGGSAGVPRAHARSASTRGPGDRPSEDPVEVLHPFGVQGAGSGDTGGDDGAVEHGGDDGVPPGEVEGGPLTA